MSDVLFIGNFLSKANGSLPISEFIADGLAADTTLSIQKSSSFQNRFLRFLSIIASAMLSRYDFLHIDVFSGNSFLFAQVATCIGRIRRKRIILTLHGGALHEYYNGREQSFKKLFQKTHVQSPSMFLKGFFESKGFRVEYCPNPVELARFPYLDKRSCSNKLLWVRAFTSIYNPEMAIQVLQRVRQYVTDATLTMVGPDQGEMNSCLRLIDSLDLNSVVNIVGKVDNNKLSQFYHSHNVFLNTTSYESFGVAVLEAASCGIPVVSNRVGEIPYLWKEGEEMLMCEPGNEEEMADKVIQLLQNPTQATAVSGNARKKAEQFSWEAVKPQWITLLQHP